MRRLDGFLQAIADPATMSLAYLGWVGVLILFDSGWAHTLIPTVRIAPHLLELVATYFLLAGNKPWLQSKPGTPSCGMQIVWLCVLFCVQVVFLHPPMWFPP